MSITITIGGTDRTAVVPFSTSGEGEQSEISIEEAVPGIAFANLRIWDATNAISVPDLASVVIADTSNGMNLFTGFVENRKYEPAAVGRWIALSCKDLNGLTDTTLVGVPDGTNWTHDDVTDQYVTTDPFAQVTAGSDASNVQALFAHYWTYPVSVDTTTYVTTVNPAVGSPPIYWDRITLRQALDELADVSSLQTIWWIDADAKLHWTNAPVQGAPTGGSGITGNVLTGFPQISGSGPIAPAPYNLSDTIPTPGGSIAAENMTREDDFAGYALSLYANGATGYTYTPPAAAATTPGHYIATFSGETLVYSRHSDGCIAQPGVLFDPGGPVYVNPQYIVPCSSGGGHFWNMKDGAKTGWLIRQTDAKVTVAPVAVTPAAATIGVGGSGWVQSGTPSYFSRYIDLPSSASQPQRDSLGGAALAFSQRFLTRGSCEVTGPAYLFRAGMGIYITSAQCSLSNAFYPIQKVTTAFWSGTDLRHATLEWGDATQGSLGLRRLSAKKAPPKKPATFHLLKVSNVQPKAGGTVNVTAQLVNDSDEGWPIAGKPVDWSVVVTDSVGNDVTATTTYAIDPETSMTDAKGQASTRLTVASTTGLTYVVIASSPDRSE